jgi:hypothetical protein
MYSHINLDSQTIPDNPAAVYRRGDYLGINLVRQQEEPLPGVGSPASASKIRLYYGAEYLWGERDAFSTARGSVNGADQRMMLFLIAEK